MFRRSNDTASNFTPACTTEAASPAHTPSAHGQAGRLSRIDRTLTATFGIEYERADVSTVLADESVLVALGFGASAPGHDDPRYLRVPLQPYGPAPLEVWRVSAPVRSGRDGDIVWATDGDLLFGSIEIDETASGIAAAARHAYTQLVRFVAGGGHPLHLLRIWNHLAAITEGEGDAERYRAFCVGRAQGLGGVAVTQLPAATAVGRHDNARVL